MRATRRFLPSDWVLACLLLCLLAGAALAPGAALGAEPHPGDAGSAGTRSSITITLQAPLPRLSKTASGADLIQADGFTRSGLPGDHLLPSRVVHVALPPGAMLDSLGVTVIGSATEVLPGTFQPQTAQAAEPSCQGTCAVVTSVTSPRLAIPSATGPVQLLPPGMLRKWHIARLKHSPYLYDPVDGVLRVLESVTVRISFERKPVAGKPVMIQDRVLDDVARELLYNSDQAENWYRRNGEVSRVSDPSDYVIITTNDIVASSTKIQAFKKHKEDHGYHVWIVTEDIFSTYSGPAPNGRAEQIRQFLRENYLTHGIKYVLLIGNPDPDDPTDSGDAVGDIPMKMCWPRVGEATWTESPTDYYYADLTGIWDVDGNGLYCEYWDYLASGVNLLYEVIVGRIPIYEATPAAYADLDRILQKIIDYESEVYPGSWRKRALLPMAFLRQDAPGAPLAMQMADDYLLPGEFSTWRMFQQGNGACAADAPFASEEELLGGPTVRDRWMTEPFGMVTWLGHGSRDHTEVGYSATNPDGSIVDCVDGNLFESAYAAALDDAHPAFAFLASCLNGFPDDPANLQYALLRNGAVATVGSSRVSWGSFTETYGDFDGSSSNPGIAYEYAKRVAAGQPAGDALHNTKASLAPDSSELFMNLLGFNLYGDPSTALLVVAAAAPAAPGGLSVDGTDWWQKRVDLRWSDNSDNEQGFRVERSPNGSDWELVAAASRGAIVAPVYGHHTCGPYYFRVHAFNERGSSDYSNVANFDWPCTSDTPDQVTASMLAGNRVQVRWTDNSDDEAAFIVERTESPSDAGSWQGVGLVGTDVTQSVDVNADCSSTYSYRVFASNGWGLSDPSNVATVTTVECVPPPPNTPDAVASQTQVSLSWIHGGGQERGFAIHRAPTSSGPWPIIATVGEDQLTYADTSVKCGHDYTYIVAAFNDSGSAMSGDRDVSTDACTPPTAPSGLTADAALLSETTVNLAWTDNSDNEYGFVIQRSPDGSAGWVEVGSLDRDSAYFQDTGRACGSTQYYRVASYNSHAPAFSNVAPGQTRPCNADAPGKLYATPASQSQIDLSWVDNMPFGAELFDVVRTTNLHREPWILITTAGPVTFTPDTGVDCGTAYYYRVRARRISAPARTSGYTDVVSGTTVMCSPTAPAEIAAQEVSPSALGLVWRDTSDDEDGFAVERSSNGISGWTELGTTLTDTAIFSDADLACDTTNYYRARAFNAGGSSSYSGVTGASTLGCRPSAPTALSMTTVSQTELGLSWEDNSDDEDGFRVERTPWGEGEWSVAAEIGPNVTAYQDVSATCGLTTTYRVSAHNDGGDSDSSNLAHGVTVLCTPVLTAQAVASDLVVLSWSDVNALESGTRILRRTGAFWQEHAQVDENVTIYGDNRVLCGTTYHYMVSALGSGGDSPSSNEVLVSTTCKPPAPQGLEITFASAERVALAWNDNSSNEFGFRVMRSPDGNWDWVEVGLVSSDGTSFEDENLGSARRHYYRVIAYNAGGDSAKSNLVSASTFYANYLPLIVR